MSIETAQHAKGAECLARQLAQRAKDVNPLRNEVARKEKGIAQHAKVSPPQNGKVNKGELLGGLDRFKVIVAFLVIAIHTSPLISFDPTADFVLTRVLARVAVPFFLMVTGYFILPRYIFDRSSNRKPLLSAVKKTSLLYAGAILIYLPVGIYAGLYQNVDFGSALVMILFEGTFYHLWYLPAVVFGLLFIYFLSRVLSGKTILIESFLLYILGLLGDSYFGFIAQMPGLSAVYEAYFSVFSYTRNGLFYAPLFLVLGAWIARLPRVSLSSSAIGFTLSLVLMLGEALFLHFGNIQRHDSMYLSLIPCMYFLFQLVLSWKTPASARARSLSTAIYILHPLAIILVRGGAKVIGQTDLLVGNSLIFFVLVCCCTLIISVLVVKMKPFAVSAWERVRLRSSQVNRQRV